MHQLLRYARDADRADPGITLYAFGAKREHAWCGPRTLPYYVAVLVTEGRGTFHVEGVADPAPIASPSLMWLFPDVEHAYGPDARGWSERWVVFDGALARSFEATGYIDRRRPVLRTTRGSEVVETFLRIERAVLSGGPLASPRAAAHVHQLIVASRDETLADTPSASSVEAVVGAVARYLDRHAAETVDLAGLAGRFGLGYSTLRRHFQRVMGTSLKGYVLQTRLARAKELLQGTDMRVRDVARAVGFDDPYHFTRAFRKREGMAPTQFRATPWPRTQQAASTAADR
jgi:AraC family transcriptional regulator, arabinose operon regulatory protein